MNKAHTLFTDLWGQRWGWTVVGRGRCWFQQERGAGQHHKPSISSPGPSPPLCIVTWHSGHPHTFMADTVHLLNSSSSKHLLSYFWKGRGGRKNSVPSNKLSKKKKKSIKPNFKMKELPKFQWRVVENSQKRHTFIPGRVCTEHPKEHQSHGHLSCLLKY